MDLGWYKDIYFKIGTAKIDNFWMKIVSGFQKISDFQKNLPFIKLEIILKIYFENSKLNDR
jgi:hypothetical protein